MATSSTISLTLLLLSAVTVSLPLNGHETQLRAFDDRRAAVEITAFQTAPFEDALAESETIDVRRHYYKLPVKQTGPDHVNRTVTYYYPRESIAAADQKDQIVVVFYHGEKANETARSSSCSTLPSC